MATTTAVTTWAPRCHPQSLLVTGDVRPAAHAATRRSAAAASCPSSTATRQIKRIGLIAYTDTKPDDFWTKLGYDWYAGL